MELAPVVLFTYNRPWHTRQTIDALQKNALAGQSDLFIYSDGPKDEQTGKAVQKVREYIHTIDGFKTVTIREREKNLGLAGSIIDGVTTVVNKYGRVVVLEDDLVTSPFFLRYMNDALEFYEDYPAVFSISAYNHPAELMPFPADYEFDVYCNLRNSSWGWATWISRWQRADWQVSDFDNFIACKSKKMAFSLGGEDMVEMLSSQMKGEIDSWAIRWSYAHFKNHAVSVCPVYSYVDNIGHDGSGSHCGKTDIFENTLANAVKEPKFTETIFIDERIMNLFRKNYKKGWLLARAINFFLRQIKKVVS